MLTYSPNDDIDALLIDVRKKYHPALADVTVATLFVAKVDKDGESSQALRHQGFPASATIKIMGLKYRALGVADAVLVIDEHTWEKLSKRERVALLDHELEHVTIVPDKRDDLGRPCLQLRFHDWRLEGFRSVVQRHGRHALEAQAVEACRDENGQYLWDWAKPGKASSTAKSSSKGKGKPKAKPDAGTNVTPITSAAKQAASTKGPKGPKA